MHSAPPGLQILFSPSLIIISLSKETGGKGWLQTLLLIGDYNLAMNCKSADVTPVRHSSPISTLFCDSNVTATSQDWNVSVSFTDNTIQEMYSEQQRYDNGPRLTPWCMKLIIGLNLKNAEACLNIHLIIATTKGRVGSIAYTADCLALLRRSVCTPIDMSVFDIWYSSVCRYSHTHVVRGGYLRT